ncbi:hypothetical protein CLAFUW4_02127 [Fulvia fulva]|uniref:Domain of unknown function at the cortex 1 domain-containing protein n=1 Tax=Passalora fulva TaxID=5499 RepID=A0A9Q8P3T1_PASFU|nr:uncharacterized protein CLAFUR5_02120 [Fulvia fulva]KAK4636098.1 hypothetical protein CLAFUR4_02123 [Fulvia fulva]KAK4638222.1 hypothetical protein CLAFUR0_02126 [Fulvia fulva]UJO12091.1 hypothetical protein CLAFUR5_02120 [Fulvia fulva]WPV09866.1 hypothetical protein CLAFUW4_02127 [Fulvia fulva]WPV24902.1 hypothetical protein CLAFUW7_02127 [Fulvia fulva]
MADKYILKVTAGPNYSDQTQISPNSEQPTRITSPQLTTSLRLRIQNYRGLPQGSPSTSPYFSHETHKHDLYSLAFTFTPKENINGHDLVLGNDFDHPIRDKLPPGFNQAFKIATWFVDPGLYGDVQADEPYLYSPLLSSINKFRVGPKDDKEQEKVEEVRANEEVVVIEEGADGDGEEVREKVGMPVDSAARQKFFLTESHLREFTFEKGREYSNDFFNPYLDFNDFALRLPGFSLIPGITIPIISYWDGQPLRAHSLRYVLKNRATDEPLFVVIFSLLPKDGEAKAEDAKSEPAKEGSGGDDDID